MRLLRLRSSYFFCWQLRFGPWLDFRLWGALPLLMNSWCMSLSFLIAEFLIFNCNTIKDLNGFIDIIWNLGMIFYWEFLWSLYFFNADNSVFKKICFKPIYCSMVLYTSSFMPASSCNRERRIKFIEFKHLCKVFTKWHWFCRFNTPERLNTFTFRNLGKTISTSNMSFSYISFSVSH